MSTDYATESPLDTAETSFRLLTANPGGLSLDCTALAADLPRGPVGLMELRLLLTSRHVTNETRDAVWRELVIRSRESASTWTVAAVGMAIPALRMIAASLTRDLRYGDPVDVDTEVLAGYLRALQRVDLNSPGVRPRLCEAARYAGERTVRYLTSRAQRRQLPNESPPPPRPWPHPDLVLIDAVAKGLLSDLDAELISLTRLEDVPLRTPESTANLPHTSDIAPATDGQEQDIRLVSPSSTTPSAGSEGEGHMASAQGQGSADTTTATGLEGGSGVTRGFARISSHLWPGILGCFHRVVWRATVPPIGQPHAWRASVWVLFMAAGAVLMTAAVATNALAASAAAAAPTDLNTVFTNLRNWLIGLLATLATLMLTIGGLRYLVAGGDPGEVQKAKAAFKAAAFGYALAVLAPLFVSVLKRVVGG
ncbi:hypothetical protein Pth03_12360 [Planotetraspora thailandica]|uniref:Uncharacterized protein n=1 Tax=Planotetraspora thailandica TaxID=487172 RepID=A0A8J3UWR2_9ACTN|nr:hypothetical protein [Planotetraspora thailandica]GII52847.1 hypothetical protein Pth03_12360 [Planotetraspora thailandica]